MLLQKTKEGSQFYRFHNDSGSDAFNSGVKQANSRARRLVKIMLEHFEHRSCAVCRYFVENNQPTKDGYCNHCNIGTYDLDYDTEIRLDVDYDFCCNKYEEKGSR
jgi:hypothetical protein